LTATIAALQAAGTPVDLTSAIAAVGSIDASVKTISAAVVAAEPATPAA